MGDSGGAGAPKDLKDFYLKAHIPKDSIKTVSGLNQFYFHLATQQS